VARTQPLAVHLPDATRALCLEVEGRPCDPERVVLAAEVVLPAQLGWGARHDSRVSGPRALMLALLEDAIHCLLTPHGSGKLARDAEAWIRTDDPAWPMSFPNVCDALGFASDTLRAALLARARVVEPTKRRWKIRLRSSREQRGIIRMRHGHDDASMRARHHRR